MSENNLPSAKPDPEIAPGEFDFAAPVTEKPRMKRRALQQATASKPAETSTEKPISPEITAGAGSTKPAPSTPSQPASSATRTSQSSSSATPTRPKIATTTQPTSPHGTRPATLYYSSGPRQEKETTPPMKTTPAASTSSSTSAASTSAPRTTTAATTTTRPAAVVDYRTNVERQSREQKSVGGVLSILVYTLIALFVLGASLAGYGTYVITKQLDQQSVTMSDFDKRYSSDYKDINSKLATTMDTLANAQAQIGRQQDLIVKQQETINKLLATAEDNASAIRQEKSARAQEAANLRARLRDLENQPTTRKY